MAAARATSRSRHRLRTSFPIRLVAGAFAAAFSGGCGGCGGNAAAADVVAAAPVSLFSTRSLRGLDGQAGGEDGPPLEMAPRRQLQNANPPDAFLPGDPFYDFSFKNEEVVEKKSQVVAGNVTIYGKFLPEQMMIVVAVAMTAIAKACARSGGQNSAARWVTPFVTQDMDTFGKTRLGLVVMFRILPYDKGLAQCAQAIADIGTGNSEPPFIAVPSPIFRELFRYELGMNIDTFDLRMDDWKLMLTLPFCEQADVVQPLVYFTAAEEDTRKCGDFLDGPLGKPLGTTSYAGIQSVPVFQPQSRCRYARTACECAAVGVCAWNDLLMPGGGMRCVGAPSNSVACSQCKWQDKCPADRNLLCAVSPTPCICARSLAKCWWNAAFERCVPKTPDQTPQQRKTEVTPCSSCARQDHCDIPEITRVFPGAGKDLPTSEISHINVTFERTVRWKRWGKYKRILPRSVQFLCRREPPLTNLYFDIPESRLSLTNFGAQEEESLEAGDMLRVLVNGTTLELDTACDLLISDWVFEDLKSVDCLGMGPKEYIFGMRDTYAPRIAKYVPDVGSHGVPLNATIHFVFNEEIRIGRNAEVTLIALGGTGPGVQMGMDRSIGTFPVSGPRVELEENLFKFNLTGLTQTEQLYTIIITPEAVRDLAFNYFGGLAKRKYVIRTASHKAWEEETKPEEENPPATSSDLLVYSIAAVGCLIGLATVTMALLWCYRLRLKSTTIKHMARQERGSPKANESTPTKRAWMRSDAEGGSKAPKREDAASAFIGEVVAPRLYNSSAGVGRGGVAQTKTAPDSVAESARSPSKSSRLSGGEPNLLAFQDHGTGGRSPSKASAQSGRSPSKGSVNSLRRPSVGSSNAGPQAAWTTSGGNGSGARGRSGSKQASGASVPWRLPDPEEEVEPPAPPAGPSPPRRLPSKERR